jgi:hypothetical protein
MRLTWSNPKETILEAALSRGDRRMADVIETAWKTGAKFDAWQDQYRYQTWLDAFQACGLDPAFYASRPRAIDEVFPWDHISAGVSRKFLEKEYQRSLDGVTTADCREDCCACGILPAFNTLRRETPGELWFCPEVK